MGIKLSFRKSGMGDGEGGPWGYRQVTPGAWHAALPAPEGSGPQRGWAGMRFVDDFS